MARHLLRWYLGLVLGSLLVIYFTDTTWLIWSSLLTGMYVKHDPGLSAILTYKDCCALIPEKGQVKYMDDDHLYSPLARNIVYERKVKRPFCIAHRGWSLMYPENTLMSLYHSINGGHVSDVELDVRLTRDGQVVLMHDSTLDRVTNGTGVVRSRDWNEYIEYLQVHGAGYTQPVALLIDLLYLSRFSPGWNSLNSMIIDIKNDNPIYILDFIGEMILEIDRISSASQHSQLYSKYNSNSIYSPLSQTPLRGSKDGLNVVLGVWNARFYLYSRNLVAGLERKGINWVSVCLILETWPPQEGFAPLLGNRDPVDLNVTSFSLSYPSITVDLVDQVHNSTCKSIYAWTINNSTEMLYAMYKGVDGILTDDPLLCSHTINLYSAF
jgi:glycerophosphoryl diester phosphodiesterase